MTFKDLQKLVLSYPFNNNSAAVVFLGWLDYTNYFVHMELTKKFRTKKETRMK